MKYFINGAFIYDVAHIECCIYGGKVSLMHESSYKETYPLFLCKMINRLHFKYCKRSKLFTHTKSMHFVLTASSTEFG